MNDGSMVLLGKKGGGSATTFLQKIGSFSILQRLYESSLLLRVLLI